MPSLREPSEPAVHDFLRSQTGRPFSYRSVGATATTTVPPAGYVVDHTRVRLGSGREAFESARAALGRWEQFQLGWVKAWPLDEELQVGSVVAVAGRSMGLWWLNACRVVYLVDDQVTDGSNSIQRSGFAYGTLPGHIEMGEERFLVEWDQASDIVWFDILAFSRPRHLMARLGYPWVRRMQKRFGRESAAAMICATRQEQD